MADSVLTYESFLADLQRIKRDLFMPDLDPGPIYPSFNAPSFLGKVPALGGMQIIRSDVIEPVHVGDEIDQIPISKHRSRRVFKKLCKRRRANARPIKRDVAYVFNGQMFMSPRAMDACKQAFRIEF